jgi:hypothetical protein
MITAKSVQMISCQDLDSLVVSTYGRPYCFQQQDGCKMRGTVDVQVPSDGYDYENDTVPEEVNHSEMGVSFAAWLARDPKQGIGDGGKRWIGLWWERNFYPNLDMILDDLHSKGLIDAGEYMIEIDW